MPLMLTTYPWKISYASDTSTPVADFYIPALERSIQYDRKSGLFNSTILSQVTGGLGAFLHNEGCIRLIMSCQLSKSDLQSIQHGYALRHHRPLRLPRHRQSQRSPQQRSADER